MFHVLVKLARYTPIIIGGYVPQMLSRGPEAHNGEDSADGRSVQFTSHCQHKIGGKQSIDSPC